MKGNFSWGITPALEKSEKDKLKEKAKKKREEELDKTQSTISKWARKILPDSSEKIDIPVPPRSLENIMDIKDIDLNIKKGEFVVIIGEVGSGKSSLINAMIGEMIHIPQKEVDFVGDLTRKMSSDELKALEHTLLQSDFSNGASPLSIVGSTGFVESQHWIQNGKFRDNVCFGSEFDERKYVEAVLAC